MKKRLALWLLFSVAGCFLSLPVCGEEPDVDGFTAKYGAIVKDASQDIVVRFNNRQTHLTEEYCGGCSYHVCGNEFPEGLCMETKTTEDVTCGPYNLCRHQKVTHHLASERPLRFERHPAAMCEASYLGWIVPLRMIFSQKLLSRGCPRGWSRRGVFWRLGRRSPE